MAELFCVRLIAALLLTGCMAGEGDDDSEPDVFRFGLTWDCWDPNFTTPTLHGPRGQALDVLEVTVSSWAHLDPITARWYTASGAQDEAAGEGRILHPGSEGCYGSLVLRWADGWKSGVHSMCAGVDVQLSDADTITSNGPNIYVVDPDGHIGEACAATAVRIP
jgi:hypothetical protein